MSSFRRRVLLYAAVALACALVAAAASVADARKRGEPVNHIRGDGLGYYAYLPSLVIDGDLDFRNHPMPGLRFRAADDFGADRNKWPIGIALTIAPAFLTAHALALAGHAATGSPWLAPGGYSVLYQVLGLVGVMGFGTLGLAMADRLVVERYRTPGWAAAAAVLGVWLASAYQHYYVFLPYMSHIVGASWVAIGAWSLHRVDRAAGEGRPAGGLLVLAALSLGMAAACRPTSVVLAPLAAWMFVAAIRAGGPAVSRGLWRALPVALVAGALPVGLQALNVYVQNRNAAAAVAEADDASAAVDPAAIARRVGYDEEERFYWGDPALVQTLFSSRAGLFFWSPILLLSAWGVLRHRLARREDGRLRLDPLVAGLCIGFVGVWYINGAWYAWWFGHSFGARAFIDMSVLYVIGLAATFAHAARGGLGQRAFVALFVVAAVGLHLFLEAGYLTQRISQDDFLLQWEKDNLPKRW